MEVAMNCKNKTKSSPVLYLRTIQFSCLRKISCFNASSGNSSLISTVAYSGELLHFLSRSPS
jgi:hypothetical protein